MSDSLSYTRIEIESYLPSGWNLAEDDGAWDDRAGLWRTTVIDGVDFKWPLEVQAAEAASKGRLEALAAAIDRTWRGRLGKSTRGLGLGTRL